MSEIDDYEVDESCPKCNQHDVDLNRLHTGVDDYDGGFIIGSNVDCVNRYRCRNCDSWYSIKYSANITSVKKELG